MSVSDARGFGQEHDPSHPEHRELYGLEMSRKLRLEIVCHDEELESVMTAIYAGGHTGHRGDGKVFVMPVIDAMRLKTGERGESAIGAKPKQI
jgi:nitrogen regulatory protein P-II 1